MATQEIPEYPVRFSVDYPDRQLNRLTSFFRIVTVIPIAVIVGLVAGASGGWEEENWQIGVTVGGVLFLAPLLMILFRQKYPRWWFDWNLALTKFSSRVAAYLFLLRDEYPSTDEEQAVHISIPYPDVSKDLNRWMPLIKWFLAIPHYLLLAFLWMLLLVVVVVAWFAIFFTGNYPQDMFRYVVGVMRWTLRVGCYAFMLTTDSYPPFRLDP
jgi:hypothetical protein